MRKRQHVVNPNGMHGLFFFLRWQLNCHRNLITLRSVNKSDGLIGLLAAEYHRHVSAMALSDGIAGAGGGADWKAQYRCRQRKSPALFRGRAFSLEDGLAVTYFAFAGRVATGVNPP